MVVELPRSPNIGVIFEKYLEYRSKKDGMMTDSTGEILKGLRCYFHMALPIVDDVRNRRDDVVKDNIYAFHAAQKLVEQVVENKKGVRCKLVARSISSVGLYDPGGTAVLPLTALMLSIEVLYCAKDCWGDSHS